MAQQILEVPTSVTVRTVADFRAALDVALGSDGELTLDIGNLTDADLSFVQLVEAARRTPRALRLAQPATGAVAALLDRAGFVADADPATIDFWFHGVRPQ